jgi:GDP-L-fucose synthase
MKINDLIYVAGHQGMVGSAILRKLKQKGFTNIIVRTRMELDLMSQSKVQEFFKSEKPDIVILAAAKVGGIYANNTFPAEFIYNNTMIQANVINSAYHNNVKKLLFLGSTCIYPKSIDQPMREEDLLTGVLEPTNEPYALAKILGIKLCESYNRQYGTDYRSVMPTNLYGINDNFHLENSHVIPALIRRFHEAKLNNDPEVSVWGSGKVKREFLFVDDMADASLFILGLNKSTYQDNTDPMLSHINVGCGKDFTINEVAQIVKKVIGFKGDIVFDSSKPDGSKRKLIDISRLSTMGWRSRVDFEEGLFQTYAWFLSNHTN